MAIIIQNIFGNSAPSDAAALSVWRMVIRRAPGAGRRRGTCHGLQADDHAITSAEAIQTAIAAT
jgi:hypothetical protein